MPVQQWEVAKPWLKLPCKLGEHPIYSATDKRLRFVDIISKNFYFIDPSPGPPAYPSPGTSLSLTDAVGCSADIDDPNSSNHNNTIIVGAKYGYAYMDIETGALTYITEPAQFWTLPNENTSEKKERMRANDGNIDPQGRFWLGMMNDGTVTSPPGPEGAVFVLSNDGSVRRAIDKVTIPNGLGWSADGKTMYFSDSTVKTIWAYDFDGATGEISNRRAWWEIPAGYPEEAVPDGFCQDVEVGVWVAVHGAGRVVKLKDNGRGTAEVVGEVRLPTRCPTCPRIASGDLFVTSAEEEEPEKFPESVKFAGSLFRVQVGVEGIEMNKWRRGKV